MTRALVTLAGLLVLAAPAAADRPATPTEAAAIAGGNPACTTVRVSTVDESWAIYYSSGNQNCAGANGVVTVHQVAGRWKVTHENSGYPFVCPIRGIPTAVARDLKLCRPATRREKCMKLRTRKKRAACLRRL